MAKRHVIEYYCTIENQYLKQKKMCECFEKQVKEGKGSLETLEQVKEQTTKLKENYDRISWIVYLLNLPNREKKVAKHRKQNQHIENYLSNSNLDAVKKENDDMLKQLKAIIGEEDDSRGTK